MYIKHHKVALNWFQIFLNSMFIVHLKIIFIAVIPSIPINISFNSDYLFNRIFFICRSLLLLFGLFVTTLILSSALVLVMAEEFQQLPKALQTMSSVLVQNRNRRTMFICGVVALMCMASTLSLVSYF